MNSLPQALLPKAASHSGETAELRMIADFFQLWRLCDLARCRRACACHGKPRECLPRLSPVVPERARLWLIDLLAARATGLTFEEVLAELANFPDDCEALSAWFKAVGEGK